MTKFFTKSFLGVLAFDACSTFTIIALYGYGTHIWLISIPISLSFWLLKKTKAAIETLTEQQRRMRIFVQTGSVILMIVLVLKWAIRINNRAAWCLSSFAFMFLLVQLYLEWMKYSEVSVKTFNSNTANQSTDPALASVTPPAAQSRAFVSADQFNVSLPRSRRA